MDAQKKVDKLINKMIELQKDINEVYHDPDANVLFTETAKAEGFYQYNQTDISSLYDSFNLVISRCRSQLR